MNEEMSKEQEGTHQFISLHPHHNFEIRMGEGDIDIAFSFHVEKNLGNRVKYWLFCKFFPFKISRWD